MICGDKWFSQFADNSDKVESLLHTETTVVVVTQELVESVHRPGSQPDARGIWGTGPRGGAKVLNKGSETLVVCICDP